ncbi:MAG TPA: segregation/condensation protein A [Firmicutes bacterium]|jgi:segregation and condensation protein A|nr:segregation/condensation protein A [Bacillota bacterium]
MSYQVCLPIFEGPFELLFHLIEKEEVAIWDIPIARITEQYLDYITTLQELDLELAGEFLVMAATLLAIKARALLPPADSDDVDEIQVDPRLELVNRLLEYRRYRSAAQALSAFQAGRDKLYSRGFTPVPADMRPLFIHPVGKATVKDLVAAMQVVLEAYQPPAPTVAVPRRALTVEGRIRAIESMLLQYPHCTFQSLLPKHPTKQDVVVTFLALLELVRRGLLRVAQAEPFGNIELSRFVEEADSNAYATADSAVEEGDDDD